MEGMIVAKVLMSSSLCSPRSYQSKEEGVSGFEIGVLVCE
jgi:hypothetical protein